MSESVVGEWARDKLNRLEKYLRAYSLIMNRQSWCKGYHYVDAFAGPGEHEIRRTAQDPDSEVSLLFQEAGSYSQAAEENRQVIEGSPRVALRINPPFTSYTFIELNPARIDLLKRATESSSSSVQIIRANCADFLKHDFVPSHNWKNERAVVFLDPFGMQVDWNTIKRLAATRAIEIFLNFPVGMAIQRLLRRKPSEYSPTILEKLNDYFGTDEWFNVLYKRRPSLFGEDEEGKVTQSGEKLLQWYRSRLKSIFGYVSSASLIRNSRGGHLYYLLLAGPNKTGAKIASDVLRAGDTVK